VHTSTTAASAAVTAFATKSDPVSASGAAANANTAAKMPGYAARENTRRRRRREPTASAASARPIEAMTRTFCWTTTAASTHEKARSFVAGAARCRAERPVVAERSTARTSI
jgi:hypothetical protein